MSIATMQTTGAERLQSEQGAAALLGAFGDCAGVVAKALELNNSGDAVYAMAWFITATEEPRLWGEQLLHDGRGPLGAKALALAESDEVLKLVSDGRYPHLPYSGTMSSYGMHVTARNAGHYVAMLSQDVCIVVVVGGLITSLAESVAMVIGAFAQHRLRYAS